MGGGTVRAGSGGGDVAASDGAGSDGGSGAGIFEAVEGDGEVAFLGEAAVDDVPLLRAESADEFFVVRDHDHAAFVVADGDGKASEGVAVEEVGGFVEDEEVRVVPVV